MFTVIKAGGFFVDSVYTVYFICRDSVNNCVLAVWPHGLPAQGRRPSSRNAPLLPLGSAGMLSIVAKWVRARGFVFFVYTQERSL